MASSILSLLALASLTLAIPAPTPAPTPVKKAADATTVTLDVPGQITFAPGFTATKTVINGKTYPIFIGGGQGGYEFTPGSVFSATGLFGLSVQNAYTVIGGHVYPVVDVVVAEADTESFVLPGVLTFHDGGTATGTEAQPTDITCTLNAAGAGCSGLVGLVTGAVLGQPYSFLGGIAPAIAIPTAPGGTYSAGISAFGSAGIDRFSTAGEIGGAIVTAPGYFSAGLGADAGPNEKIELGIEKINGSEEAFLEICEKEVTGFCTTILVT